MHRTFRPHAGWWWGCPLHRLVLLVVLWLPAQGHTCPRPCTCGWGQVAHLNMSAMMVANCSGAGLTALPAGLPDDTQYLDLSLNAFTVVSENRLEMMPSLRFIDLRHNKALHSLPLMEKLENLTKVWVDEGFTCCIYEVDWERKEGYSRRRLAQRVCWSTLPYTECYRHLLSIASMVAYAFTFLVAVLLNPWVLVVTAAVKERRKDPFSLINAHFCTSNLMITTYAGGLLVVGASMFDVYPYHMEEWLNNPGCGALGYLLISASLASTLLYTVEIIIVFLKIRYPFDETKHVKTLHLHLATGLLWALSFGVAAVPFALGRYNAVGLCLPFYAGDFDFSFKYVLLYTAITNLTTVLNMTLHVHVLRVFITKSKETSGSLCAKRRAENKRLRNTVVVTLVFYVLTSLAEMVFLVMSCIGGSLGQIGREWWARMVVVEALINPLTGPVKSKRFRTDTRRLWANFRRRCRRRENRRRPSSPFSRVMLDLRELKERTLWQEGGRGGGGGGGGGRHEILVQDSPLSSRTTADRESAATTNALGHISDDSGLSESPVLTRVTTMTRHTAVNSLQHQQPRPVAATAAGWEPAVPSPQPATPELKD